MTKEKLIEDLKYKPYWRSVHESDIYRGMILNILKFINDKDIEIAFRYVDRMISPWQYGGWNDK